MRALDTFQYFEIHRIEIARADAAEHGVQDAGRAVYVETQIHQPVDHGLNLRFGSAFLHYDYHWVPFSIFAFCTTRISSMILSKMRCTASGDKGPGLLDVALAKTSSSRLGS